MGFAQLCGQIAPIASVVVFMAPLPTMKQISEDKSVGALPLLPYTSMCLSATLWALYGLLKDDPNIWITNLVGLAMGSYYFYHFTRHAPKKSSSLPGTVQQHVQAIGIVGATSLLLFFSKTAFSVDLIGYAAVILCLAMFASPLSALQTVIQTRSSKSIPLPFTVASFVNCFAWTVYGIFIVQDPNIYITNGLGLSFSIAQLALKGIYPSGPEMSTVSSLPR